MAPSFFYLFKHVLEIVSSLRSVEEVAEIDEINELLHGLVFVFFFLASD